MQNEEKLTEASVKASERKNIKSRAVIWKHGHVSTSADEWQLLDISFGELDKCRTEANKCVICNRSFDENKIKKCIDHNHESYASVDGKEIYSFRGILCGRCNLMIGIAETLSGGDAEGAAMLERAAAYLRSDGSTLKKDMIPGKEGKVEETE